MHSTDRQRKVLFLIRSLEMGGAEKVFSTYVNNVRSLKPIVLLHRHVIAPTNVLNPGIPCREILHNRNHRMKQENGGDAIGRLGPAWGPVLERLSEAREIRRELKREKCEVLSGFLMKSNLVSLLLKVFFLRKMRIIVNAHEYMSQHLLHFYPNPIVRRFYGRLVRLLLRKADRIVAVADSVRGDLIENFGAPPDRTVVVHNPIDLESIRRDADQPPKEEWWQDLRGNVVVAVGRLARLKGFDLLIRAFARVPEDIAGHLVIVGNGGEEGTLRELAAGLGLDGRILFTGATDNPYQYMARADLFVLPSRTEAFPTVLGEALALGVPVLAADCSPGVREYLMDGEYGLLVPPENVDALADGLEKLLADRDLRKRMSVKAPERVALFDLPLAVREYEKVIKEVLDGH